MSAVDGPECPGRRSRFDGGARILAGSLAEDGRLPFNLRKKRPGNGGVRVDSASVLRHTYLPTALPPLSLQPGGLRIWPILVG